MVVSRMGAEFNIQYPTEPVPGRARLHRWELGWPVVGRRRRGALCVPRREGFMISAQHRLFTRVAVSPLRYDRAAPSGWMWLTKTNKVRRGAQSLS